MTDGVVQDEAGGGVILHPASGLDAAEICAVQPAVRRRRLRATWRRGLLSADDAQGMAERKHGGGFSVDVQVRIEAHEREGLERLLRCCAPPALALERLLDIDPEHRVRARVRPGQGAASA